MSKSEDVGGAVETRHFVSPAGPVGVIAARAFKGNFSHASFFLEYRLLRFVVHASLAKVVHGLGRLSRWSNRCEGEGSFAQLVKLVVRPQYSLLLKLSNACTQLACLVFERIDFISGRRLFFLELERGILNVDDPIVERLSRLGQLRIVTQCNRTSRQFHGGLQGTECCANCCNNHSSLPMPNDEVSKVASDSTRTPTSTRK